MTLFTRLTRSSRSALRYGSRVSALAAITALGTMAACGGGGDATGPGGGGGGGGGGVASVAVSPTTGSIAVGATTTLTATPLNAAGTAVSGVAVTWGTSDANVATVSSAGVVTGVAAGTATISATSGSIKGTATITVTPAPVASVSVSPTTGSIAVGATTTLTATPLNAAGTPVSGATVTWATADPNVATVNSSGVVTGVGAGTTTITASSGTVKGTATITVTPPPVASVSLSANKTTIQAFVADSLNLGRAIITATLKDASGNTLSGRTVTWTSSKSTVATVSSTGVVDAIAPGTTTITATSEGKSATIDITVTMSPVAKLTVSPLTSTITVGQSEDLDVRMYDAAGNELVGVSHGQFGRVIQVVVNPASGIITVSSGNHVTGAGKGSATVTYSIDGASVTATINVN